MERWSGKVAVVTGASAGIGAATALALADAGMKVVAVARRVEPIEALSKKVRGSGKIFARHCDVSKEADIRELFEHTITTHGGVDVLINNAGILTNAPITNVGEKKPVELETVDKLLAVNVRAPVLCTQLAVASMRARAVPGHVIFVNSIEGHHVPTAENLNVHIYPATKYAITAIVEIIRREFSAAKVPLRITDISPGAVDTEMFLQAAIPVDIPLLKSEDVADSILYALSAPQHVNIHEVIIRPTGEML